ncbi:uncharacterized protein MONOS_17135 [Monocercomonoides exilis]|uniref:uncharacterized protein n=1 Tax=Monocercomonoides exilis TaxID=2049356 RepID=UPI00355A0A80|nr:hypothetical protein MONOS_17135 [Monocercomonoides exilis]
MGLGRLNDLRDLEQKEKSEEMDEIREDVRFEETGAICGVGLSVELLLICVACLLKGNRQRVIFEGRNRKLQVQSVAARFEGTCKWMSFGEIDEVFDEAQRWRKLE